MARFAMFDRASAAQATRPIVDVLEAQTAADLPPWQDHVADPAGVAILGGTWDGSAFRAPGLPAPDPAAINVERDRRIAQGFTFGGKVISADDPSKLRISGAAQLAFMAMASGRGDVGDLRWHGGQADFGWIAQDNTMLALDAPSMLDMGRAAAAWEQSHIFAARALKDMEVIPADFASDVYWPAG